jgi:hypothetical protein
MRLNSRVAIGDVKKHFSGVKPPDPRSEGRPRLTRPGKGASNAGQGGEAREGRRAKGGERREKGKGMGEVCDPPNFWTVVAPMHALVNFVE